MNKQEFENRMKQVVQAECNDNHVSDEERQELLRHFSVFFPTEFLALQGNDRDDLFVDMMEHFGF